MAPIGLIAPNWEGPLSEVNLTLPLSSRVAAVDPNQRFDPIDSTTGHAYNLVHCDFR